MFIKKISFIIIIIVKLCDSLNSNDDDVTSIDSQLLPNCPIYLTLSTLSRNTEESNLEINWGPNCKRPPYSLAVYRQDPSIMDNPEPEFTIETMGESMGYRRTNIKLGKLMLTNGWNPNNLAERSPMIDGPKCLSYYVASHSKSKKLLSLNCLKIQPNWMSSMKHLSNVPLKNIFIPGTHCSGCFPNRSTARSLVLRKYGLTQNFDVWTQLVFGIRYLDINIGFNENKGHNEMRNFWIVNESIFITPFINILYDIKKFIQLSGEIVIMDISGFPIGFYDRYDRHMKLIELLEIELGDIAFRRKNISSALFESYDLTMEMMRNESKLLIINYNCIESVKDNNLLWNSWTKYSTMNLRNSTETYNFMRKLFTKKYNDSLAMTSIMDRSNRLMDNGWVFEGVHGIGDGSFNSGQHLSTIRERANIINKDLRKWLGGMWSLIANVVTVDYFLNSFIIDIAIYTNNQKTVENNNNTLISFDMVL